MSFNDPEDDELYDDPPKIGRINTDDTPPLTLRGVNPAPDSGPPPPIAASIPKPSSQLDSDRKRLSDAQSSGSGISRLPTAARIPLRILEGIGSAVSPGTAALIPGTELHHNAQLQGIRGNINQDIENEGRQATAAHTQAETAQLQDPAIKDAFALWQKQHPGADISQFYAMQQDQKPDAPPDPFREWLKQNPGHPVAEWFQAQNDAKPDNGDHTDKTVRVVNGVPHEILIDKRTGADVKDLGQTKVAGESPDAKRSATESAQVERESRGTIRKAEGEYRNTQKSVAQLTAAIDQARDGNGLLTSFVPTMEVLGINAANGVHRISPAEAQAANLPGGWSEQFNAWFDKASQGKTSPQLAAEGKQLAKNLLTSSYQRYKSTYDDENGIVAGYGGKDFNKRVPMIPQEAGGGGGGKTISTAAVQKAASDHRISFEQAKQQAIQQGYTVQ